MGIHEGYLRNEREMLFVFKECQNFGYDALTFCYEFLNTNTMQEFLDEEPREVHCSVDGIFELLECDDPDFVKKFKRRSFVDIHDEPLYCIGAWIMALYHHYDKTPKEIYNHFTPEFISYLYSSHSKYYARSELYVAKVILGELWNETSLLKG
jgi:hypothetical protein